MAKNSKSNPALQELQILIGRWEMELSNAEFLPNPSATVKGNVSFEWLEDGAFLIMRMGDRVSEAPSAIWLMHRDDANSDYKAFYYDDRKVSRIYEMSFSNNIWSYGEMHRSFRSVSKRISVEMAIRSLQNGKNQPMGKPGNMILILLTLD